MADVIADAGAVKSSDRRALQTCHRFSDRALCGENQI
jgi:hypothetical protein